MCSLSIAALTVVERTWMWERVYGRRELSKGYSNSQLPRHHESAKQANDDGH